VLGIVRNRQSLVSTTGFRRRSGQGRGLVPADGPVALAGGRLASQGKFAEDVPRATAALLPGTGGTGASKSGGQTKQASPPRRAGARHLR
jgi:hypothetical protein